jgi:large subunit ribosomal protein L24e
MVLKTEVCRFSGLKIYPGHGMRLTKIDSQTYLFLSAKCKRLFNLRLRPAKLAWTTQYRKAHKKVRGVNALAMRRRRVGADWRRRRGGGAAPSRRRLRIPRRVFRSREMSFF